MPSFFDTRLVHHSALNMYKIIADVEQYPQYLPLCEALKVKSREERRGKEVIIADMTVAYKVVRETYSSRVILDREKYRVFVESITGPFHHLDNRWTIKEVSSTSCDVDFYIDYEFKSRPLQLLMGSMFDYAFHKFSDAFVARADEVYGAAL